MTDIADPFCPISPSKCLLHLTEQRDEIDRLIEYTQEVIEQGGFPGGNLIKGSVSGAAVAAATDMLKQNGGRVLLFTSNFCLYGFGATPLRNEMSIHNENKSHELYTPGDAGLKGLVESLKETLVSVDLFSMSFKSFNFVTLAQLCKATGGQAYHYNISDDDWDLQFALNQNEL